MALLSLGRNVALEAKIANVTPAEVNEDGRGAVMDAAKAAGAIDPTNAAAIDSAATKAADEATDLAQQTAESTAGDANEKLGEARRSITETLAPWIPGDFLVIYGTLLTAWTGLRGDFWWMLGISVVSAGVFVFLGAAVESGGWNKLDAYKRLTIRAVIGAAVSLAACFAVPNSGWYDFSWMVDNETSVVLTAAAVVGVVALALKSLPKWLGGNQ